MLVATLACVIGLAVVVAALLRDPVLDRPGWRQPSWTNLPDPAEAARVDFPMTFPGYDPGAVESHVDALARAYADLLAVAPDEVRQRAAWRMRARQEAPTYPPGAGDGAGPMRRDGGQPVAPPQPATDAEALRAEAALTRLEDQPGEPGPAPGARAST